MRYIDSRHKKLDKEIADLSIRSDILKFLDPINKFEELEKFISRNGNYKPTFIYQDKHILAVQEVLSYIDDVILKLDIYLQRYNDLLTIGMLEKCKELRYKFELVLAYHEQDFDKINQLNISLFGDFVDPMDIDFGSTIFDDYSITDISYLFPKDILILEDKIDKKKLKEIIQYNVSIIWLDSYKVRFEEMGRTAMQVSIGNKPIIYINKKSDYGISSIAVSVLHEIYGHLHRRVQGSRSDYYILKWGTWFYLAEEEGVATFQWARYEWYQKVYDRLYDNYQFGGQLLDMSWYGAVEYMLTKTTKSLEYIYRSLLRWKRGLIDPDKHNVLYKDKIYFDGYLRVCDFINKGEKLDKLMMGRIKIDDIPVFDK